MTIGAEPHTIAITMTAPHRALSRPDPRDRCADDGQRRQRNEELVAPNDGSRLASGASALPAESDQRQGEAGAEEHDPDRDQEDRRRPGAGERSGRQVGGVADTPRSR